MKKKTDPKRALRNLLTDREYQDRFPCTQIDAADPPRFFPLVEKFAVAIELPVDVTWVDQHGYLTLVAMETGADPAGGLSSIEHLLASAAKIEEGELLPSVLKAAAQNDWKKGAKPGWVTSPVEDSSAPLNNAFPLHASTEPKFAHVEQPLASQFGAWFLPTLWKLVEQNIDAKRFRMIVAAEHVPAALVKRVKFLRGEGKNIYALETGVSASDGEWKLFGTGGDLSVEQGKDTTWLQEVMRNGKLHVTERLPNGVSVGYMSIPGASPRGPKVVFKPSESPSVQSGGSTPPSTPPGSGSSRARAVFSDAGLAFPAIPEDLIAQLQEIGSWLFSTRPIRMSPYNIGAFVQEARIGVVDNYAILAHAGHGMNSWALHYFLVRGPLAMFLQLSWGGVYGDAKKNLEHIRQCFALADRLLQTVEAPDFARQLESQDRLFVIGSDFYGSEWNPPGGKPKRFGPLGGAKSVVAALEKAITFAADTVSRNPLEKKPDSARSAAAHKAWKTRRSQHEGE